MILLVKLNYGSSYEIRMLEEYSRAIYEGCPGKTYCIRMVFTIQSLPVWILEG